MQLLDMRQQKGQSSNLFFFSVSIETIFGSPYIVVPQLSHVITTIFSLFRNRITP